MSRALINARSLFETSEKNSDINTQVSSFGYTIDPDSEMDAYTEAGKFRRIGEFCRPLGDAMPLAVTNLLQMPIVLITSAQNMPIVPITPRTIRNEVSVILAYTQRGAGHYDAVTERSNVRKSESTCDFIGTQNNIGNVGDSTDTDKAKGGKEQRKGNCHLQQ